MTCGSRSSSPEGRQGDFQRSLPVFPEGMRYLVTDTSTRDSIAWLERSNTGGSRSRGGLAESDRDKAAGIRASNFRLTSRTPAILGQPGYAYGASKAWHERRLSPSAQPASRTVPGCRPEPRHCYLSEAPDSIVLAHAIVPRVLIDESPVGILPIRLRKHEIYTPAIQCRLLHTDSRIGERTI